MSYPPPPWNLRGQAVYALQLVEIERARPFVPAFLNIVPVLPGKTLGIVFFARYGPGSVLEYHELIVAPALVRHRAHLGFWTSHIYVDSATSMAGGHEVWGLPKELAEFTWALDTSGQVTVRQGEQALCSFRGSPPRRSLPLFGIMPGISQLGSNLLEFRGSASCRLGIAQGTLEVPPGSPFAPLHLARSGQTFYMRDMKFVAHAPHIISAIDSEPSTSRK